MTHYDSERWAEATTRGRHVFNYHFRMFGHELKGWELVKVVTLQDRDDLTEAVYMWQHKEEGPRRVIRVAVDELDSWRTAHARLRGTLDHCMRPSIPPGTGRLARIGDVNLVAREPKFDEPAAVTFSRGNVCVFVNSVGELNIDVSAVAASIDRGLIEQPLRKAGPHVVRTIMPKRVVARREGKQPLIRSLSKTVPRDAWLKVIAPDGELRREGDRLVYIAPKAGTRRVGSYLMTTRRKPTSKR